VEKDLTTPFARHVREAFCEAFSRGVGNPWFEQLSRTEGYFSCSSSDEVAPARASRRLRHHVRQRFIRDARSCARAAAHRTARGEHPAKTTTGGYLLCGRESCSEPAGAPSSFERWYSLPSMRAHPTEVRVAM
jgi:hypothetical protein